MHTINLIFDFKNATGIICIKTRSFCLLRDYLLLLLFILHWIMPSSEGKTAGTDEPLKIKILFPCKYL